MKVTLEMVKDKILELRQLEMGVNHWGTVRIKPFKIFSTDDVLFTTRYFSRDNFTKEMSDNVFDTEKPGTVKLNTGQSVDMRIKYISDSCISFYGQAQVLRTYLKQNEYAYARYVRYIATSWYELGKHEDLLKRLYDWATANLAEKYSILKKGGVLEFTNKDTSEKLWCDLVNKKFTRSYTTRKSIGQVNYPAQFFKNVSGRVLIGQFKKQSTGSAIETLINQVAYNYPTCTNFGTFLVKMFDHIHLEEYISANVKYSFDIPYAYSEFPKDVRKKLDSYEIPYTTVIGSLFCSEPDTGKAIFSQIQNCSGFKYLVNILSKDIQALNTLVNYYNYDIKTMFSYFRERNWSTHNRINSGWYYGSRPDDKPAPNLENPNDAEVEVLNRRCTTMVYDIVHFFRDYVVMSHEVYGANRYDRYPKDLKAAHDAVQIIHATRKISETTQKSFEQTIDTSLEWKSKEFQVIYPKNAGEVVAEGKILRHCVGSYIDNVIQGRCKILFLRTTENPNQPLVTLEVANNSIRQARGVGNSAPKYDAAIALKEYAKAKKLVYV